MTIGGIVLCGGRSSRMGRPKPWLPFGEEVLLQRVVRILGSVVEPVVVVAAAGQDLPELSGKVELYYDERPGCGPLAGLEVGLTALQGRMDAAYVTGCDVPRLQPAFVREMIVRLGTAEVVLPREGERWHPLAGVYRTSLATTVSRLLAAGERRLQSIIEHTELIDVNADLLRSVDPELASLANLNTPEAYTAACVAAGVPSLW